MLLQKIFQPNLNAKASKQELFLKFVTSFLQVLAQAKKFVRVLALLMEMSRGLGIGTVGLSGFHHYIVKILFNERNLNLESVKLLQLCTSWNSKQQSWFLLVSKVSFNRFCKIYIVQKKKILIDEKGEWKFKSQKHLHHVHIMSNFSLLSSLI